MTQPYHHGTLRAALLAAAEAILDRDGIAGLTLRATAREAGVSHAAPTHHFGDLTGLLTALAATGFIRFHAELGAGIALVGPHPADRLVALGRCYVTFAVASPGLFQLMFRSERLDWSSPALVAAGEAAFALLTLDEPAAGAPAASRGVDKLTVAMTRWSLVHGLATLVIDGRVAAMAAKVPGAEVDRLIEAVLARLTLSRPAAP